MKAKHCIARLCLVWVVATGLPLSALAAAGRVQFATGDVQMRRDAGLAALASGASLETGDTVLTGATGRAQLRFTDGGLVSLYPDSEFTVTRYVDSGDPAQDSFAVSFLRGSMRAITGLIGKRNPANYKLTTPTAVVGIRGSAYRAFFNPQGQLEVGGEQDEIEVCTQAGCVGLKVGESVLVLSSDRLAVYTNTRALLPLPTPGWPFAAGEQVRNDGSNASVFLVPVPVVPVTPTPPGAGGTTPGGTQPGGTAPGGGTTPGGTGGTTPGGTGGTQPGGTGGTTPGGTGGTTPGGTGGTQPGGTRPGGTTPGVTPPVVTAPGGIIRPPIIGIPPVRLPPFFPFRPPVRIIP